LEYISNLSEYMTDVLDGQGNVLYAIKDVFDPQKDAEGDEDDVLEGVRDGDGSIGNVLGDQTDGLHDFRLHDVRFKRASRSILNLTSCNLKS